MQCSSLQSGRYDHNCSKGSCLHDQQAVGHEHSGSLVADMVHGAECSAVDKVHEVESSATVMILSSSGQIIAETVAAVLPGNVV